jgi:succinyl-CoA synthetase beta subunit
MNLHEYQAKAVFAKYGLPVPRSEVASNVESALEAATLLGGQHFVVKAQVHAGGRGKAGGVKLVDSRDAVADAARGMLGRNLVTFQTDEKGQPVNEVLVELPSQIARELYLSAVMDRGLRRVVVMASTEGGMDIEEVAEHSPEKILKAVIDPLLEALPYQARDLGFKLGLNSDQIKEFTTILTGLVKMFDEKDLSLVEINPLIVNKEGHLVCLDGKVTVDDSALYRQAELREMRDASQEDPRENLARDWELNYIALSGDIGCMVNGAGLAMATMDIIKLHGGSPANFLDVGGGATKERVTEAFKIILSDENVKGILVNIFGGIVRCDLIADGIISAVQEVGVSVPVVVRLEGNNAELGAQKLEASGLNIIAAQGLTDAAQKVIQAVKEASK